MKQCTIGIFALLAIILSMSFTYTGEKTKSVLPNAPKESTHPVKWYSLEEASKLVQAEPRKVFVDIYTDWCGWCKRMDADTFHHSQIAEYLNENFYPVKLNGEQRADMNIYGTTFSYVRSKGGQGYHEAAAMLMKGQSGYPTVVFLNEKMQPIIVAPGYQSPIDMDKMMRFVNEGHLEAGIAFKTFERNFRSRIKMK